MPVACSKGKSMSALWQYERVCRSLAENSAVLELQGRIESRPEWKNRVTAIQSPHCHPMKEQVRTLYIFIYIYIHAYRWWTVLVASLKTNVPHKCCLAMGWLKNQRQVHWFGSNIVKFAGRREKKYLLHIHIFHVKLHGLQITNIQLSEVQFTASTQTRIGRRIRQEERWRVNEKWKRKKNEKSKREKDKASTE